MDNGFEKNEQEIEELQKIEQVTRADEDVSGQKVTEEAVTNEQYAPLTTEKRKLNKTLVAVGVIVLLAVLVMAGYLVKTNFIDKMNSSVNVVDENKQQFQLNEEYAKSYKNGTDQLSLDYYFYKAYYYASEQKSNNDNKLDTIEKQKVYWADQNNLKGLKESVITYLEPQVLTYIKAVQENYKSDSAKAKEALTQLEQNYISKYGTLEKVNEEIKKAYHISFDQFKNVISIMNLSQEYSTDEPVKIAASISDAEAKLYIKDNKDKFKTVQVRHILISNSDSKTGLKLTGAKLVAAQKLAKDILKKVDNGEDMAKLALKYSADVQAVKQNKGIYDVKADSNLVPEFKDFALSNKLKATGIVATDYGFHVMRVEKITDTSKNVQLKTVKDLIAKQRFNDSLDAFIKKAKVDVIANQAAIDAILPLFYIPEPAPSSAPQQP
ncbi:MAG: peptidylprolyl isomerase [Bacillota bacterium]